VNRWVYGHQLFLVAAACVLLAAGFIDVMRRQP
jgi:hypothetical protein